MTWESHWLQWWTERDRFRDAVAEKLMHYVRSDLKSGRKREFKDDCSLEVWIWPKRVKVSIDKICMLPPNLGSHPISSRAAGKKSIKFYSTSFSTKWLLNIKLIFCVPQSKNHMSRYKSGTNCWRLFLKLISKWQPSVYLGVHVNTSYCGRWQQSYNSMGKTRQYIDKIDTAGQEIIMS